MVSQSNIPFDISASVRDKTGRSEQVRQLAVRHILLQSQREFVPYVVRWDVILFPYLAHEAGINPCSRLTSCLTRRFLLPRTTVYIYISASTHSEGAIFPQLTQTNHHV
jgi:hypothetical protein